MIPFCAKQGVERKISFEDFLSAMLSDYECAYACGLAARKLGVQITRETPLPEAKAAVEAAMGDAIPSDYRVKNLYQLIRDYTLRGFEEVPEENPAINSENLAINGENLAINGENLAINSEIAVLIEMGLESTYLD